MSLISRLIEKIFGNNQQKNDQQETEPPKSTNDYFARWEKERQERIKAAEERLKDWIIASVKEKGSLSFSWESGNDEAFVTFQDKTDIDEDNYQDLEEYIIDKLNIPDAGEFQMNGSGNIYIDGNVIKVKYSSALKDIIDFNEETEEEIYGKEEQDSGDEILFSI